MSKDKAIEQILSAATQNTEDMHQRLEDTLISVKSIYDLNTAAAVKVAFQAQCVLLDLMNVLHQIDALPDIVYDTFLSQVIKTNSENNGILFHLALGEPLPINGVKPDSPAYLDLNKTYDALLKTYCEERERLASSAAAIMKREGM